MKTKEGCHGFGVCVSGLVLAIAVRYAFTEAKYEANMKVLVRKGRADAPVSATESALLDLTRMAITEEELNSEVELVRDDEVLRWVVEETGVGGRDWLHSLRLNEGNAQRVERAARRLTKQLQVQPVKKTNLIAISYAAEDPRVAAKVLKSVANPYLDKHMIREAAGKRQEIASRRISISISISMAEGRRRYREDLLHDHESGSSERADQEAPRTGGSRCS